MKKINTLLSALALTFIFSSAAQAKGFEITNNQVVSTGIMNSKLSIPTNSGSDVTFSLGFEGAFEVANGIQISVPLFLAASSNTAFQLNAGPQFNFGEGELLDQFFATVRPGFIVVSSTTNFVLNGAFGKRFKITESVSFRPSVGANVVFVSSNTAAEIYLSPASFSIEL